MAEKRKQGQGGRGGTNKRSKGGNGGRWKTPKYEAKMAEKARMGSTLDVGDQGIWVTFVRGMETKAVREFEDLCHEYGQRLYGLEPPAGDGAGEKQGDGDIEACVAAEMMQLQGGPASRRTFSPVSTGIECVFFMKTAGPVQPGHLVRTMCQDARDCPDPRQRKCRYINRLSPVLDSDKATDKGVARVARSVLAPWFCLAGSGEDQGRPAYTYAIRYRMRNHTALSSDRVIKTIAGLVDARHKVDLGTPDKVILVEIFQGDEWEALKRYNLDALYGMARDANQGDGIQGDARSHAADSASASAV